MEYSFFLIMSIIFGSIVGSFLNVCIYRMPQEKSIVFPGSYCPSCQKHIRWYDNIPVLSFLLLGAKCRNCKAKISWRYPLIELLTVCVFVISFFRWYPVPFWGAFFFRDVFVLSSLIAVFLIDLEHKIIPNEINFSGLILAYILNLLFPQLLGAATRWQALLLSVSGMLVGGGLLLFLAFIGEKLFKKEAMGMGDVKLLAMLGAFFGPIPALLTIVFGSFLGAIIGGVCMLFKKVTFGQQIPFGPFLAVGCIIVLFWGQTIVSAYLRLVLIQ